MINQIPENLIRTYSLLPDRQHSTDSHSTVEIEMKVQHLSSLWTNPWNSMKMLKLYSALYTKYLSKL